MRERDRTGKRERGKERELQKSERERELGNCKKMHSKPTDRRGTTNASQSLISRKTLNTNTHIHSHTLIHRPE